MIKYIITSEAFTGEVVLTYDEKGERPMLDVFNTNMRVDQHKWIADWIYESAINHNMLLGTLNGGNTFGRCKFRQVVFEPTFANFWAAYFKNRHKDNSSKKTAERRWNNMPKGEQLAAYNYIKQYFFQIPEGTQPKLAETYLSSEVWVK